MTVGGCYTLVIAIFIREVSQLGFGLGPDMTLTPHCALISP